MAVLPFEPLSGPDDAYLGNGVAHDLTTALAGFPGLRALALSTTAAADRTQPATEVADALGARWLVEGAVRREGARVGITAQPIDGETGENVWAAAYDETGTDVLAMQAAVAGRVFDAVAGIEGRAYDALERAAWAKTPIDLTEYDFYLRGNDLWMNGVADDDPQACAIWREGLAAFPKSALLRVKLGFCIARRLMDGASADRASDLKELERLAAEARAIRDRPRLAVWLGLWLDVYVAR